MNLKINVPYIRCEKPTFGLGRDKVYFAIMVGAAKREGDRIVPTGTAPVYFAVSDVQGAVGAGSQWTPALNDLQIDIGDAEAVTVTIALYECDSKKIHDQMQKEAKGPITPEGFPWDLIKIPTNPADLMSWIVPFLTLLRAVFTYFPQDDLIGQDMITTAVADPHLSGPRDKEIRGYGGKYHFLIDLSVT